MKSLQVELRSVKSFCVYRSEIPASVATSHGPKSGSAKPSLMMPDTGKQLVRVRNSDLPLFLADLDGAVGLVDDDRLASPQNNP
jgi:hypothetical protein